MVIVAPSSPVSERAWGTVREDYSDTGDAWNSFPHDHARSRAYRWNEDGLAGMCNRFQNVVQSCALWNGRDAILKACISCISSLHSMRWTWGVRMARGTGGSTVDLQVAAVLWLKEEACPSGLPLPHRSAYLASQARKETTERTSKSTTFTLTRRRRTAT